MSQTIVSQVTTPFAGGAVTHTVYSDGSTADSVAWDAGTPPANRDALTSKATAALASNVTYIGLASPSTAQNTAQIKALARQVDALIKLTLGLLDDTTGT